MLARPDATGRAMLYISCQVLNYCAVLSFGPTFQSDMALVAYVRGAVCQCKREHRISGSMSEHIRFQRVRGQGEYSMITIANN